MIGCGDRRLDRILDHGNRPAECPTCHAVEDPFSPVEMAGILDRIFGMDKPFLWANDPDLEAASCAAWDVVRQSNIDPVSIFRVGGHPSRLEWDDAGEPAVKTLSVARLRQEMASRTI